jgi:hypothetical protein
MIGRTRIDNMTTETHDFSYLECKNGEKHEMDNVGNASGITSCYKCEWKAQPAWIVHQMVYMSGGQVLSVDETIKRNTRLIMEIL